jgi:hypothetical protein
MTSSAFSVVLVLARLWQCRSIRLAVGQAKLGRSTAGGKGWDSSVVRGSRVLPRAFYGRNPFYTLLQGYANRG